MKGHARPGCPNQEALPMKRHARRPACARVSRGTRNSRTSTIYICTVRVERTAHTARQDPPTKRCTAVVASSRRRAVFASQRPPLLHNSSPPSLSSIRQPILLLAQPPPHVPLSAWVALRPSRCRPRRRASSGGPFRPRWIPARSRSSASEVFCSFVHPQVWAGTSSL